MICAATQPKYEITMHSDRIISVCLLYLILKKSPNVSKFMRYRGRAKIKPKITKQMDAPKGSEINPRKPPSKNVAEIPRTVSAPNQVANTMASTMGKGKLRPAVM